MNLNAPVFLFSLLALWAAPIAGARPRPTLQKHLILVRSLRMEQVDEIEFSPTKAQIALLGASLTGYDYARNKVLWRVKPHGESSGLIYSPDGKSIALFNTEGQAGHVIRLIDAATGRLQHTLSSSAPYEEMKPLAFSADGKTLAFGSSNSQKEATEDGYDMAIVCLDAKTRKRKNVLHGLRWCNVTDIAFSPDSTLAAATSFAGDAGCGELAIWNLRTGKLIHYFAETEWTQVVFLDNHRLWTGDTMITLKGHHTKLQQLREHGERLPDIARHQNNPLMLTYKCRVDGEYVFEVWKDRPRKKLLALPLKGDDLLYALSPSHAIFALEHQELLRIWQYR